MCIVEAVMAIADQLIAASKVIGGLVNGFSIVMPDRSGRGLSCLAFTRPCHKELPAKAMLTMDRCRLNMCRANSDMP